ncbi:hypothetical protein [Balneatrix alpica]|uniref:Lipoprotein n=1 Tax=Balneatrix alpica TaxID=75684 RepID=A0ABV5Z8Z0_9GAMM|nr:hypothetical protein [Balneatrix alpica]
MRSLWLVAFVIWLSGCATVMQGQHKNYVNPYQPVQMNAKLVLEAPLEAKGYLDTLTLQLLGKGFSHAYVKEQAPKDYQPDYRVLLSLGKSTGQKTVSEPQYGYVNEGWRTECVDTANGRQCNSVPQMSWEVVGYQDKQVVTQRLSVSLEWLPAKGGEAVLKSVAESDQAGCADDKLYRFLLTQAVQRMDFLQSREAPFQVEMPEDYSCQ